jgi:hypothetical protein
LRFFLLNYHIGRIVGSIENNTTNVVIQQKKSQAPDDGYINVRNMLST